MNVGNVKGSVHVWNFRCISENDAELFTKGPADLDTSLKARAAGLNQDGIGIYDISPFAFPRSKSGKYPFSNLVALVRDFMDAFFYVQSKESVQFGNRTVLHMGKARESFARGLASARSPTYREALIQLFGQDIVDLPDIILTDGSISCVAGPGF